MNPFLRKLPPEMIKKEKKVCEAVVFKVLDIRQQKKLSLRDNKQIRRAPVFPQLTFLREFISFSSGKGRPHRAWWTPSGEEAELTVWGDQETTVYRTA